jgi:cobalt-precorrin-5B (C1)-methyltransferase
MSSLRSGFTTGTCAAAAAKAAALLLLGRLNQPEVEVELPDGERVSFPIVLKERTGDEARAGVRKDAGDDPDVTHGVMVIASVAFKEGTGILYKAGEGIGTVTKAGLSVAPGGPAINPVPREMITRAVSEVTDQGLTITLSIPGGQELAAKTFNPRLGIVGGLSILGTTGRVRPFSCPALRESLRCSLSVAWAAGIKAPVFVPGHIGERAARNLFSLRPEQVIEVSNEWGFMLDCLAEMNWEKLLVLGHPGKLAKLADGHWDTHSSRSQSPLPYLDQMSRQVLQKSLPDFPTVEGLFASLGAEDQKALGDCLAGTVQEAVLDRLKGTLPVAVVLVDLKGHCLGQAGELNAWKGEGR